MKRPKNPFIRQNEIGWRAYERGVLDTLKLNESDFDKMEKEISKAKSKNIKKDTQGDLD